jgi:hemoglobin
LISVELIRKAPHFHEMAAGSCSEGHGIHSDNIRTGFVPRVADKIDSVEDREVYSAIGEAGFARLISGFYRRVPEDDILGPMYGNHDLEGAEQRLRNFLIFRFGGPVRYIESRGHPRLRMRHARFRIDQAARDRWLSLMNAALDEASFPEEGAAVLRNFFGETATFLMNQSQP